MKEKISAVYKIVNTVTGDFYIGSSRNVKKRWETHKCPSEWKYRPSKMYQDMQKYGVDKFRFQILVPVMPEYLKQVEQELMDMLRPTYNKNRAKGWDVERHKEYFKTEKAKELLKKSRNKYFNKPCEYNGETLTLAALAARFRYDGIPHSFTEAKKYLI